jgi:hypothetical protein
MGFRDWALKNLITADAVYGLILYSALIAAVSDDDSEALEVLLFSGFTLIIFWAAHVFAGTVAGHGGEVQLRTAMWKSFGHSSGMLYASILPSIPLVLAVFHVLTTDDSVAIALLIAMLLLGVLGYKAFASRKSPVVVRILGGIGTALFGFFIILLNIIVH